MARLKKTSQTLDRAQIRLQSLRSISTTLDFGDDLNLDMLIRKIIDAQARLDAYNLSLSVTDQKYNDFKAVEKELAVLTSRFLTAVAAKFGKDSNEYEMAGGVRSSERKRPERRPQTAPTT